MKTKIQKILKIINSHKKPWLFFSIAGLLALTLFVASLKTDAATSGPNNPATAANDASVGTVAWVGTGSIFASDDSRATVSLDDLQISNYLKATGFGFSIPTSATIDGVTVEIERMGQQANRFRDNAVRIIKGGAISTTDRSSGTAYPTADAYATYGGATDLWGETWTPADINGANFGVALSSTKYVTTGGAGTVSVDHIRITIDYSIVNNPPSATTPTSITQATNGSGYITFSTTISDPDSNETKLKIEYSDNGGSTWYDPDLISATPDNGAVDLDDAAAYQVGTTDGIDTDGFANVTLTIVWDTKSALNGGGSLDNTDQSDIQIRVTPNDSTVNGTTQTSANFQIDNLDPIVADANISIAGGTGTSGAYKIGDSVTTTWNNSAGGDNNSGLSTITANLFPWGGSSTAAMTDTAACGGTVANGIYEACYTITGSEGIDADNQNTSVTATDSFGNSATTADTTNAKIDTIAPTGLTALVAGATGSTTQTLNWTAVTETSFDHYEIWYGTNQSNVANRTASEWDNSDDVNLATRTTNTTTITGLSPSTTYYFKIWAVDDVGNEETVTDINTTTTAPANNPPSATTPFSISQYTNGSGYVSFQTTISDADLNNTKLKVEYSDDGGGTWKDPDLISATPSSGTVDLDDATAYQIGTSDNIDTSGGSVTLTIIWDTKSALNDGGSSNLNNSDQPDIQIRVTPNDGTVNGSAAVSANFPVDNLDPSGLTALTAGSTSTTTQVLNWSAVTENNFDHYEIWYGANQSDVQGRTGTANEWDGVDDVNLATISTTTTTITGLSSSTLYYFKIWAIDDFGNEQTVSDINTTTGSGNSAPSATTPASITQATNGSGYITFSTTITDTDSNETKLKVEYSDNGGVSWKDPDLISATPNNGAVDMDDANTYQIGTVNGIDTDGFSNVTLVIVWDTKSTANDGGSGNLDGTDQSDIRIRVIPNDGTIDGSTQSSSNFSLDNLSPSGLTALTTGTATSITQSLSWSAVTETSFDHYEIWYGTNQTDVASRSGTAIEWDGIDDINLATISTTTTTITGLTEDTTYYYKIWAIDDFGNEHTVAGNSKKTNHKPVISGTTGVQQTNDGFVNITYTLSDNDSNTSSLNLYEYSLNNSTWFTMTAATGDPAHQGVSGLTSSPAGVSHTFVWDAKADTNGTFDSTVFVRLRANDGIENGNTDTSASFALDVKNPIGLASFAGSSATTGSITWTWTAVTAEDNFNHYEIWYGANQSDVQNRTGTAVEWDGSDDAALSTQATATTTITGLAASTLYYAKIWAVDGYQNEATTTDANFSTGTPNSAPTATAPASISQAINGSGYITFSTTISDPDSNETKLKIEYSDNGGASWKDPDLISATPNNGAVDLDDANTYQVGTVNGIDTDGFASVTLVIIWDTKSPLNDGGSGNLDNTDQSDIRIRVTPNDGIIDSTTPQTSANFQVDNLDPDVTAANVFIRSDTCTGTGGACKNGDFPVLRWDGNLDGETDTIASATFNGSQLKFTDSALSGTNLGLNIWETLLSGALDSQEDIGNTISVIVTDNVGNSTGPIASSTSYIVDTVLPTAPGNLSDGGSATNTAITLNFGSAGSDGFFGEYKIFYNSTGGVTENDSSWTAADDSNLGFLNYNSATSTTVTGLSASTNYFFNIWIYDQAGNKTNATEIGPIMTTSGNSAPNISNVSASQQIGSGYVDISYDLSDADFDNSDLIAYEYSLTGDWAGEEQTMTLVSGDTTDLPPDTYNLIWNALSDLGDLYDNSVYIRLKANDGIDDSGFGVSPAFAVDVKTPVGLAGFVISSSASSSVALAWTAVSTENNFNHYEIWYGQVQGDVQSRSGTASEWDNVNDTNLSTISTTTTTIAGLSSSTTYYFKIWAIDDFGNEQTVGDINTTTLTVSEGSPPVYITPPSLPLEPIKETSPETIYDYQYISQSANPIIKPGETTTLTLTLKNTGNIPWYKSGMRPTRLGTSHPNDRISIFYHSSWISGNRMSLKQDIVNPGEMGVFEFTIQAPFNLQLGIYREYFTPVVEGITWMKDVGIYWEINAGEKISQEIKPINYGYYTVIGGDTLGSIAVKLGTTVARLIELNKNTYPSLAYYRNSISIGWVLKYDLPAAAAPVETYNYEYIYQSPYPAINSGETTTLTLNIKNTGNIAWYKTGLNPTRLGTSHPQDRSSIFYHSSWLSGNRIALKQDVVNPGEIGTFEFVIQAPATQGIYKEYFTPVVNGNQWMKDIGIYWDINVGVSYGYYTVIGGDTLGSIAVKLGTTVARLIELNKNTYPSLAYYRNSISIGWVLKYEKPNSLFISETAISSFSDQSANFLEESIQKVFSNFTQWLKNY